MSHFTTLKTTLSNKKLLNRTLDELKIAYVEDNKSNIIINLNFNRVNNKIIFQWNNSQYNLITDLQIWENENLVKVFLQRIVMRYQFLNVLSASTKASLMPKSIEFNKNEVKLTLETY